MDVNMEIDQTDEPTFSSAKHNLPSEETMQPPLVRPPPPRWPYLYVRPEPSTTIDDYTNPLFMAFDDITLNNWTKDEIAESEMEEFGVKGKEKAKARNLHEFLRTEGHVLGTNDDKRQDPISTRTNSWSGNALWTAVLKPIVPFQTLPTETIQLFREFRGSGFSTIRQPETCDCCQLANVIEDTDDRPVERPNTEMPVISNRPRPWNTHEARMTMLPDRFSFEIWTDAEAFERVPGEPAQVLPHSDLLQRVTENGISFYHSHADRAAAERVDLHHWGYRFPITEQDELGPRPNRAVNTDIQISYEDRTLRRAELLRDVGAEATNAPPPVTVRNRDGPRNRQRNLQLQASPYDLYQRRMQSQHERDSDEESVEYVDENVFGIIAPSPEQRNGNASPTNVLQELAIDFEPPTPLGDEEPAIIENTWLEIGPWRNDGLR